MRGMGAHTNLAGVPLPLGVPGRRGAGGVISMRHVVQLAVRSRTPSTCRCGSNGSIPAKG